MIVFDAPGTFAAASLSGTSRVASGVDPSMLGATAQAALQQYQNTAVFTDPDAFMQDALQNATAYDDHALAMGQVVEVALDAGRVLGTQIYTIRTLESLDNASSTMAEWISSHPTIVEMAANGNILYPDATPRTTFREEDPIYRTVVNGISRINADGKLEIVQYMGANQATLKRTDKLALAETYLFIDVNTKSLLDMTDGNDIIDL